MHIRGLYLGFTHNWLVRRARLTLCTSVRAIGRCDVIALPHLEKRHLPSLSQGFWLHEHPLSLACTPIGSPYRKGHWERTMTLKISWLSGGLFRHETTAKWDVLQTFLWVFTHRMSELVFFIVSYVLYPTSLFY